MLASHGYDASRPEYYNNLGNLPYPTFDDTRAYKAFEKAIILDPNCTEAYCGLARILLNMGEFETAISICQKLCELILTISVYTTI